MIVSTEPWSYGDVGGRVIRTEHYRVMTTTASTVLLHRLPRFQEAMLSRYTSALAVLPGPDEPLDTYLFADREQWQGLVRRVMGGDAGPYLRISRGGFARGGRALLYDIGPHDTLALAAHEGWHQYTQHVFAEPLPAWLEEGVATYMEGFRWPGNEPGPRPMPWANVERFDQLRRAASSRALLPLPALLDADPRELLDTSAEGTLTYYAQVWALAHFLHEGEGGRYANALGAVLNDAAAGRLTPTLRIALGDALPAKRFGSAVFAAYFNPDMQQASQQYNAFIAQLLTPGAKERIVRGSSPIGGSRGR